MKAVSGCPLRPNSTVYVCNVETVNMYLLKAESLESAYLHDSLAFCENIYRRHKIAYNSIRFDTAIGIGAAQLALI